MYINYNYLKNVFSLLRLIPSLRVGGKFYNTFFPRRGNLLLYITNRCNSKCLICNHWKQQPKHDLSVRKIAELIKSKTIGRNNWTVQGGEVFLHPEIDEILHLLHREEVNYTLFSNGIMTDRLVRAVEDYKIKSVNISLDGGQDTYGRVRGYDGYWNVLESIDRLKDITTVQVNYTASPYNTFEDYEHVKRVCRALDVRLMLNIYCEANYSGVIEKDKLIDERYTQEKHPYPKYYNKWVKGEVKFSCLGVLFTVMINPNGDVVLCLSNPTVLGNIYDESIDAIWNYRGTKEIHRKFKNCNKCFISCQKYFDVRIAQLRGKV